MADAERAHEEERLEHRPSAAAEDEEDEENADAGERGVEQEGGHARAFDKLMSDLKDSVENVQRNTHKIQSRLDNLKASLTEVHKQLLAGSSTPPIVAGEVLTAIDNLEFAVSSAKDDRSQRVVLLLGILDIQTAISANCLTLGMPGLLFAKHRVSQMVIMCFLCVSNFCIKICVVKKKIIINVTEIHSCSYVLVLSNATYSF